MNTKQISFALPIALCEKLYAPDRQLTYKKAGIIVKSPAIKFPGNAGQRSPF